MAVLDVASIPGLRAACETIMASSSWNRAEGDWVTRLANALERVRDASLEERGRYEFQKWWWDDESVAATGQGNVNVDAALRDDSFRQWLAQRSKEQLPGDRAARIAALDRFHEEIQEKFEPYLSRMPHLKILRVIATIYPEASTTVCDRGMRHRLAAAMGARRGMSVAERNVWILERLEEALGPVGEGLGGLAERMALPWFLYLEVAKSREGEATETFGGKSGQVELAPLPAARRIKGLTAITGGLPLILSTLEFAKDGVTKEELIDHLRTQMTGYKTSSLGSIVSVLQSNFGVLRRAGDQYLPTVRGESLLESQDPSELSDWLLTRILGVDSAIVALRDERQMPTPELFARVKAFNPGWKTNFSPSAIVQWLRKLDVIATDEAGTASLTERGKEWADRIVWKPEPLAPEVPDLTPTETAAVVEQLAAVTLPAFESIAALVRESGNFPSAEIARLHAGIWAHQRRHFAILTGLSGSGKTLLARAYGRALAPKDLPSEQFLHTVTVQPGWYDPGALLGYANPLRDDSYVTTPFLEFVLAAAGDPVHAYTAVLDEMNLSHPEQYMAPLLSAMETGGRIDLHSEGDIFDEIPASISYPQNLVLIGTVNMDETTHGLSDKVLDRAFTMEFWDIDLSAYPRWETRGLTPALEQTVKALLGNLMDALSPSRLHFGWRVVDDVLDFLVQAEPLATSLTSQEALDGVVYAKVLPKLRGEDSPRFRDALRDCSAVLERHQLTRSLQKVADLAKDLESTGSARFWR